MMNNPEFNRNLWLEFSTARLAISPIMAAAIIYIAYLGDPKNFFESLIIVSSFAIWILVVLWGVVQASGAVLNEVNGNTWSFQKMSGISAWDMVTGKLFGSTSYIWYSASFFILAYIIGAFMLPDTMMLLKSLATTLMGAVIAHSLIMMISLLSIQNSRFSGNTNKGSAFIILGIIIASSIASPLTSIKRAEGVMMVNWYSIPFDILDFYLLSLIYFLIWSIVGLYRTMRAELQYDNGPAVWSVFLLTFLIYMNGITLGSPEVVKILHGNIFLWTSFAVLAVITYVTMMGESFDPVALRKIIDRFSKKDIKGLSYLIPLWFPAMAGMLVFAVLLLVSSVFTGPSILSESGHSVEITFLPLALILFILRDFGVIGLIKSDASPKSNFYVLVYLVSAYLILPLIVGLLQAKELLHVFLPVPADGFLWQVVPVSLEVAFVAFLIIKIRSSVFDEKTIIAAEKPPLTPPL